MTIKELVDAEMDEYYDGAYADHGCARDQLERFAQIIRNQALEDALAEVEQGIWFDKTTDQILESIAAAIRSMKKEQS